MWFVILIITLSHAFASPNLVGGRPGSSDLDAGDIAWSHGQTGLAHQNWTRAAESDDPSVRAMAEIRLLYVSGSFGMVIHGPRADAALDECPTGTPWCDLAEADYQLLSLRFGLPGDLERAVGLANASKSSLPAAAMARLVLSGAQTTENLSEFDTSELDGLGQALLTTNGQWATGPGTWTIGVSAFGVPGMGTGAAFRWTHPDIGWKRWRSSVQAAVGFRAIDQSSHPIWTWGGSLTSPGQVWWHIQGSGKHGWVDLYCDEQAPVATVVIDTWKLHTAPGLQWKNHSFWLGPQMRWDAGPDIQLSRHGLAGGWGWQRSLGAQPLRVMWTAEGSKAGFIATEDSLSTQLDVRRTGGHDGWASWFLANWAPIVTDHEWLLPAIGGGRKVGANLSRIGPGETRPTSRR